MIADAYATDAGRGSIWVRVFARIPLVSSLVAKVAIDSDELTFIIIVLPAFV